MHERKSFSQYADEFLSGKGFYIVLFACVAVIGVSAWLLLFSRWSPLGGGDEGDYLDVMGDVSTSLPEDGGDLPAGNVGGDSSAGEDDAGQPEHTVPSGDLTRELNDPGTGDSGVRDSSDTLKVTDKPEDEKPADSGKKDTKDSGKSGGTAAGEDSASPEDGAESAPTGEEMSFVWPVAGEIIKPHSPDTLLYSDTMGDWRTHEGVDIAARLGTRVLSCANGAVLSVQDNGDGRGTVVVIDHGCGFTATYANLAGTPTVAAGDLVTQGSVLGSVGATSLYETAEDSHLHFALTLNGESVDPETFLPKMS